MVVVTVMTLALAFVAGGILWLTLGTRLSLDADEERNNLLNLGVYVGVALVPAFLLVFYVIELLP